MPAVAPEVSHDLLRRHSAPRRYLTSRSLEAISRLSSQTASAAMDIRIACLIQIPRRVQSLTEPLAGRGRVEIDDLWTSLEKGKCSAQIHARIIARTSILSRTFGDASAASTPQT